MRQEGQQNILVRLLGSYGSDNTFSILTTLYQLLPRLFIAYGNSDQQNKWNIQ